MILICLSTRVLDPARTNGRPLGEMAEAAIRGGITFLQLRVKSNNTRETSRRGDGGFRSNAAPQHSAGYQ